jgi:hypothetical protein
MVVDHEEAIVPFAGPVESIPLATEYRSTWLASSQEGLRLHGHFERYEKLLTEHRDEILGSVAGAWVSIDVAMEHYRACEQLGLPTGEIEAMARNAGTIRRQWHATIIAAADRADTTVWDVLPLVHKAWLRTANGGAVAVYKLGARKARVEYVRCRLLELAYYREAVRVVILLLGEHLCHDLRVLQLPSSHGSAHYQLQWRADRALERE